MTSPVNVTFPASSSIAIVTVVPPPEFIVIEHLYQSFGKDSILALLKNVPPVAATVPFAKLKLAKPFPLEPVLNLNLVYPFCFAKTDIVLWLVVEDVADNKCTPLAALAIKLKALLVSSGTGIYNILIIISKMGNANECCFRMEDQASKKYKH